MREDELDRIIDAGLSTYAEAPAGIEGRVLAAVAANDVPQGLKPHRSWRLSGTTKVVPLQSVPRSAWRMWAVGLSMAACVLIAVTVGVRVVEAPQVHHEQAANDAHAPVVNHPAAANARNAATGQVAGKRRAHRNDEARMRRLPKKELFPTPQPLSPEMQALAQFVARAPEAQRRQLIDAQAKLDAPITIAPLQIAPLKESSEDEQQGER